MVTIKDIAKAAGVAQGTVSNVLNGKGNVSSEKIKHVQEVAAALGYIPNERAKLLRKGHANILALVLPSLCSKQYLELYLSFANYAENSGYSVQLYFTNRNKETELSIIQQIKASMAVGVATISECRFQENIYSEINPNSNSNANIVFIERKPSFESNYIGFDYEKAGITLGKSAIQKGYKNICLITGSLHHSNEVDFYNGFSSAIDKGTCIVRHIQTDNYRKQQNIMQALSTMEPEAIFISDYQFAESVKDICNSFYTNIHPEFYTVSPVFILPEKDFNKYELNYRFLGSSAAKMLINSIREKKLTTSLILESSGIRNWSPEIIPNSKATILNVLALDSPSAYTMRNLARIYTQITGINVNFTIYSYDEIYEAFTTIEEGSIFDVIRLDVTWLSWFAPKILCPLTDIDPNISNIFRNFIPGLADKYSIVNGTYYALPSTPSVQLLYYRKDLFDNAIYKRMYYEMYKKELMPPTTFEEFNHIARFFTKDYNPSSPVDYGASLTLGSTGVAGSEFLARYFSHMDNLYDDNLKIRLNSPIAVQSLEELIELKNYSNPKYNTWWTDTASSFAKGNVAMSIIYNNYASPLNEYTSKVVDNIGYTAVPGNNPVIGGGSLGISKYTRYPKEAMSFIKWMCSEPIASCSTLLGSVSPCKKTYDNYEIIDTFPWLKLTKHCFSNAQGHRTPPNVEVPFNERRFLSIIGTAVKNVYSGAMQPKEALDYAQQLFEKQFIT